MPSAPTEEADDDQEDALSTTNWCPLPLIIRRKKATCTGRQYHGDVFAQGTDADTSVCFWPGGSDGMPEEREELV